MANIQPKNIIYRLIFETQEAVRAIKGVDTATKKLENTTDSLKKSEKENQKAFVTAANKREQLIKEERQDLIELRKRRAQAYSIREIEAYNKRIAETNKRIETLKGSTGKASKQFDLMGSVIGKLGGVLATTFAVERIGSFVAESVKLANQTKNVRNAFNQLAGATTILNQLRIATGNTVDDLTLMQAAVRADKFKIPLQQLATFFKFASDRAAETGQSVDFLVNRIVDGIGRKSALVLDDLAISTAEIQEEFKKTGDFGQAAANIIEREMAKANVNVDEGARAAQRLETSYKNLQSQIGQLLAPVVNELTQSLSENLAELNKIIAAIKEVGDSTGITAEQLTRYGTALFKGSTLLQKFVNLVLAFRDGQKENTDTTKENTDAINDNATANEELNKGRESTIRNLFLINQEIAKLTEEQNAQGTSVTRVKEIEEELNGLYKERDALLGKTTEKTKEYKKSIADLADELERLNDIPAADFGDITGAEGQKERVKFYEDLQAAINEAAAADRAFVEQQEGDLSEFNTVTEDGLDKNTELYLAYANTITGILRSINTYQNQLYDAELQNLQKQLDNKVITEQQFSAKVAQQKRKRAQSEKNLSLFEIAINTASSAIQTAATLGYPAAIPFVALAIAEGAAQAALVAAQPIPAFAEGVIGLKGPGTETSDSIPAMLSKGESVMTAKETRNHKDVFEAIRSNSFDEFARKNYIEPALLNYTIKDGRERNKQEQAYNDYRLVRAVKGNSNVGVKNADDIGRSVARHMNHNNWIGRKFR